VIGSGLGSDNTVDNQELIRVNDAIRAHPVEQIGARPCAAT
jgi:ketol-acid reductoisomerase